MREGVNPATNHRIMIGGASSYFTQTMVIHVILVAVSYTHLDVYKRQR